MQTGKGGQRRDTQHEYSTSQDRGEWGRRRGREKKVTTLGERSERIRKCIRHTEIESVREMEGALVEAERENIYEGHNREIGRI